MGRLFRPASIVIGMLIMRIMDEIVECQVKTHRCYPLYGTMCGGGKMRGGSELQICRAATKRLLEIEIFSYAKRVLNRIDNTFLHENVHTDYHYRFVRETW